MTNPGAPLVIGIAGGSGSGKTTVAREIMQRVGTEHFAYLPHDAYYRDLSDLPTEQRAKMNFDHPDALDTPLLIEHVKQLKAFKMIELPIYDFKHDTRTKETIIVQPKPIVMVEGILIFVEPDLRALMDVKIFVDTDADIRFIRRLQRDIQERGRTTDSVIQRYLATVRPMHLKFVEYSKRYADVIIPEGGYNQIAIDMVSAHVKNLLET
jgi:uridine kinase